MGRDFTVHIASNGKNIEKGIGDKTNWALGGVEKGKTENWERWKRGRIVEEKRKKVVFKNFG